MRRIRRSDMLVVACVPYHFRTRHTFAMVSQQKPAYMYSLTCGFESAASFFCLPMMMIVMMLIKSRVL